MEEKKILITCTELMMIHFLVPHVNNLLENNFEVEIACSEVGGRFNELSSKFIKDIKIYKINLIRNPFNLRNLIGLNQLKKIIKYGNYDLIWTNEPVMGVMTRIAAKNNRKKGLKVMYITHGFHFYDGGPLLSWILYYPIEKLMSKYTDILVTINKEDYKRAQNFYCQDIEYIPGIGLDTIKIKNLKINKEQKRKELGLTKENIILLSVGELGKRKNHIVAIEALGKIQDKNIFYLIAGIGKLEEYLKKRCKELGIEKQVLFLGYRKDVYELCNIADIYIFPSKREGLGIAGLEGMAAGLPIISSDINGIKDYTENEKTGYCIDRFDINGFKEAILKLKDNKELRDKIGNYNQQVVEKYDLKNTKKIIKNLIERNIE